MPIVGICKVCGSVYETPPGCPHPTTEPNGPVSFQAWMTRLPMEELMGMILVALEEVERREGRRPLVLHTGAQWAIVLPEG